VLWVLLLPLVAILLGSLVYSAMNVVAAWKYKKVGVPPPPAEWPPLTLTTPLAGVDLGLEENLRSSFEQDYPDFELVFAVRSPNDPCIPIVRRVMADYPQIPSQLLIVGEPQCPNAKVWSLQAMTAAAKHSILVMNDSDIRSPRNLLRTVAAEFADPKVGLATCPYRAVPARGWAARLEALLMNTQFLGGVLTARMLEGMKFALGPSAVVRKAALEQIGGWQALNEFLAEDFVLGQRIAEAGWTVLLSAAVVEHHIGGAGGWSENLEHRLRWVRSTRRSRPAGYVGEVFTNPLPLALLVYVLAPVLWPLVAATVVLRAAATAAVASLLKDPLSARYWWAIPLEDLLAFGLWVAGFFGNTVTWRGRRYLLHKDGRFTPVG